MRIAILSLYSDADSTGIAKYTAEMAEWLSNRGHEISVITAVPHYPEWRLHSEYKNQYSTKNTRYTTYYVPIYIPNVDRLSTLSRFIYEASFSISIIPILTKISFKSSKPSILISIYPSMPSVLIGYIYSKFVNIKNIVHVQDLQAAAADSLKMVKSRLIALLLKRIESFILDKSDHVTTITPNMANNIKKVRTGGKKISIIPNWADIENVNLQQKPDAGFGLFDLNSKFTVMYSGSMGEKQGLRIILQTAEILRNLPIRFIISGDGPYKKALLEDVRSKKLSNIDFIHRQPAAELPKLLSIADVHLIIQKSDAADLVMPSKLTNIAAAGRPVIATTISESGLGSTVIENHLGVLSKPEDPADLAKKICGIMENKEKLLYYSKMSRQYAENNLSKNVILSKLEDVISEVATGRLK